MNFLSHFYFDQNSADSYLILGTVLPDLLKNADKTINIHPEKLSKHPNNDVNSIITGWKKHLEVDKFFHSSEFFKYHSHELKLVLRPAIEASPVKPFFLGHIALELILDNLLITTQQLDTEGFYAHLSNADKHVIDEFLRYSRLIETDVFFRFYDNFINERYLLSYAQASKITYALRQICKRIWQDPFTPAQEVQMTDVLANYRRFIQPQFLEIFDEIEHHLNINLV